MKILITGGLGFQGSHLAEHFQKAGHEVTVLNTISDRAIEIWKKMPKGMTCVWGSITDKELVKKTIRDHDVIFHLAARINVDESIKDPAAYLDVNIYGTYNVLEAVREYGNRLIHASTCEVYGAPEQHLLIKEDAEMRPHSPYAASKAGADRLCFAYYKTYGLDVTMARPFNIYGERQKEKGGGAAIAIFVKRILDGQPIVIFGDGLQTRDYMNIDDLVQAYDLLLKHDGTAGEVFNFGTGVETSIKHIAEHIAEKMNGKIEYQEPRPGEVKSFIGGDITKSKSRLGFLPKVGIWDGIDRYITWRLTQNK
ncbi:MAG: GDP-mannose 4,6-dehydratase [Patescibacteria group bacterium]|jgi:dTDP-glucose 4,6-dehydratase